jgi:hypothetical protein
MPQFDPVIVAREWKHHLTQRTPIAVRLPILFTSEQNRPQLGSQGGQQLDPVDLPAVGQQFVEIFPVKDRAR